MRYVQIILLLFVFSCGKGQDERAIPIGQSSVATLLPKGEYMVDVMDKITMSPKTKELMQKFQVAMERNPDWFLEARQRAESGPLPYDERIGMSEDEYKEFLILMQSNNGMEMTKSGVETIIVSHEDNKVSFKATGVLKILNEVTIDASMLKATIGQFELRQIDTINVTDNKNALRSSWKGYTWRHETANKDLESLKTVEDYKGLNMQIYKVTLGQLERNSKIYMQIQVSEIENGQKTIDIKLPFIFQ